MRRQRIALLCLPGGVVYYGPPLGIHRIYGFLLGQGYDVELTDCRIEFWRYWLSAGRIAEILEGLRARPHLLGEEFLRDRFLPRFALTNIWSHGRLYPQSYVEPQRVIASFLMGHSPAAIARRLAGWTPGDTRELVARLADDTFWKFDRSADTTLLVWGSILLSLHFFPTIIKPDGIFTEASPFSSEEITAVLDDARVNPMVRFAREFVAPLLEEQRVDTLGMSVPHESGVIPALTVATQVKALLPQVRTILGGMQVSLMAPDLARVPSFMRPVDYLVCSAAGEAPLDALLRAERDEDVQAIPGVYAHRGNAFATCDGVSRVHMDQVGRADYPKKYRRCYNSFMIMTSLHCYWKKCTFCTYTHSSHLTDKIAITKQGNWRGLDLVVEEMRQPFLWPEGAPSNYFYIEDSAMPPGRLLELLEDVHAAGLDVQTYAFMRFTDNLLTFDLDRLRRLGLRKVFMGLEAGSQRVNDLMMKGVNVAHARTIARRMHDSGIQVNLGTIVGFPTETPAEAQETLDFLLENRAHLHHVEVNPLRLEKTAPIFYQAPQRGIEVWKDDRDDLSFFYQYRLPGSIGSEDCVPICNRFNFELLRLHEPEIDWELFYGCCSGDLPAREEPAPAPLLAAGVAEPTRL
jgi:Radical SAM superfamily